MTYADLNRWADSLAAEIGPQGEAETVVGALGERRPATIAALIAIWKAGAAFLPLDPLQPPERLAGMIRQTGCNLAIGSEAAIELPGWSGRWISAGRTPPPNAPPCPATPDDPARLAYVAFTSGSTGTPKGVQVEHGTVGNYLAAVVALFPIGPDDRVLQFASLGFDVALEEILGPLWAGGQVVLADRDELLDPGRRAAVMTEARVTIAIVTPSALEGLDPDGMCYVVEIRSGPSYRTYMYQDPQYKNSPEAQHMTKIVNIFSEEFGV